MILFKFIEALFLENLQVDCFSTLFEASISSIAFIIKASPWDTENNVILTHCESARQGVGQIPESI